MDQYHKQVRMEALFVLKMVFILSTMLIYLTARHSLNKESKEKIYTLKQLLKKHHVVHLVLDEKENSNGRTSKLALDLVLNNRGECAFTFESNKEEDRLPRYITVAKLKKDSTSCYSITREFTVFKKRNGPVYKPEKQVKIVGFREIPTTERGRR